MLAAWAAAAPPAWSDPLRFDPACASREVAAITFIDDHGAAEDLPADRLGASGLALLEARAACYQGRVLEALAIYDAILRLEIRVSEPRQ